MKSVRIAEWPVHVMTCVLALLSAAAGADAQERETLVIRCAGGPSPEVLPSCQEAVLALEAIRAGVGMSMSQGSETPGFASTVGLGDDGLPRVSTAVRFGMTRLDFPVLLGSRRVPAEEGTVTLSSLQANVAVGVFNGFRGPGTTRGILSLDLLGQAGLTFLPSDDGFQDSRVALGYGARVGILREGFSNPGVSVSIMRRDFTDNVRYGSVADEVQLGMDPTVTSARLVVGRDFFRAGFTLGVGWDRIDGDVSLTVRDGQRGSGSAASSDFDTTRLSLFAGGQYTWRIFQGSVELGWAEGFEEMDGYEGDYDPTSGTVFGNVAVRLTF